MDIHKSKTMNYYCLGEKRVGVLKLKKKQILSYIGLQMRRYFVSIDKSMEMYNNLFLFFSLLTLTLLNSI